MVMFSNNREKANVINVSSKAPVDIVDIDSRCES